MEEILILKAQPIVRDKLRTLFWIRLSSFIGLVLPAAACTAFLWVQSRPSTELVLPGAEPALDASSTAGMYTVVWNVWLPLAFMSLATGGILAWLAWRAYLGYTREYRLTPQAVERRDFSGTRSVPWGKILALEVGQDLTLRVPGDSWHLAGDWLGRETADAAERYLKERLPKEKVVPVSGALEIALEKAMKLAPTLFALLTAAITAVAMYWVFLRSRPPTP